jgi:hypothetical protein
MVLHYFSCSRAVSRCGSSSNGSGRLPLFTLEHVQIKKMHLYQTLCDCSNSSYVSLNLIKGEKTIETAILYNISVYEALFCY